MIIILFAACFYAGIGLGYWIRFVVARWKVYDSPFDFAWDSVAALPLMVLAWPYLQWGRKRHQTDYR